MDLKEKIIVNYSNDIGSTIEGLISIGIVNSEGSDFLKYDIYEDKFKEISFQRIKRIILKAIPNYWGIKEEELDILINNKLEEVLPVITVDKLEAYYKYVHAEDNVKTDKELKQAVKEALNKNKKRHKKVFLGGKLAPEFQVQALINEDVFLDNKRNYVKYDKDSDSFKYLSVRDVFIIVTKYFKYQGRELEPSDVQGYIKEYYPNYISKIGVLAYNYNVNPEYKRTLKELKEDYISVKNIIDKFE